MGETNRFWGRLAQKAEPLSGLPIVEIAGEGRVLIENHLGIQDYHRERILVKVKFGAVTVCGENLKLTRMTREQLVICGKIHSVSLQRRERP